MEITTYNPDGTIKEKKFIDIQVPEHVKVYDDQRSFINITEEEMKIVNSRRNTFKKTMIVRQLTTSIKHDYSNYKKAAKKVAINATIDTDTFIRQAESNVQIQSANKIISSIMRIFGNRSLYRLYEVNIDEQRFLEQSCSKEEFRVFLADVGHYNEDFHDVITEPNWIKAILYHAFKASRTFKLKYGNKVDEETRIYISLQNLINRYYNSLRFMERATIWMPAELKFQMYILGACIKNTDNRNLYRFNESRFAIQLINALYLIKEKQRSYLYKMVDIVYGSNPAVEFENRHILHNLRIKDTPKTNAKEYEITLHDCFKRPFLHFYINDDEICALRIPSSDKPSITILQGYLNELYKNHIAVYQTKWENNIQTDSEIYFNKQKPYHEDWLGFYHHKIEKYRAIDAYSSDLYKPQRCFYLLLCNNVHPNKNLYFAQDIIIDLLDLLKIEVKDKEEKTHNDKADVCDSQIGLYEGMFKINRIKEHVGQRSASDEAVTRALKFLEPLFAPDCEHVDKRFRVKLRTLMCNLLSHPGIKPEMTKVTPNGFTGEFNLEIVYNILGLFRETLPKILNSGSEKVDNYLRNNAVKSAIIHKTDNKIRKGLFYDKCNTYNQYHSEIEKKTCSFIDTIVNDSK